jgi:hypothetical protein
MDYDPNFRNNNDDSGMNIFSKRPNNGNNIKNYIPIKINMLRNINP